MTTQNLQSDQKSYFSNTQVDFDLKNKVRGHYSQLVSFKKVDACEAMREDGPITIYRSIYELLKIFVPGDALHACPYLPGHIKISNITLELIPYFILREIPCTDYTGSIKFYDDKDRFILEGSMHGSLTKKT